MILFVLEASQTAWWLLTRKRRLLRTGGPGPGQSGVGCVSQTLGPGVWGLAGVTAWVEVDQLFHLRSFLVYQMWIISLPPFHTGLPWLCPPSYRDPTLWPLDSWGRWGGFATQGGHSSDTMHGSTIPSEVTQTLCKEGMPVGVASHLPLATPLLMPDLVSLTSLLFKVLRVNYDVYYLYLHSW